MTKLLNDATLKMNNAYVYAFWIKHSCSIIILNVYPLANDLKISTI